MKILAYVVKIIKACVIEFLLHNSTLWMYFKIYYQEKTSLSWRVICQFFFFWSLLPGNSELNAIFSHSKLYLCSYLINLFSLPSTEFLIFYSYFQDHTLYIFFIRLCSKCDWYAGEDWSLIQIWGWSFLDFSEDLGSSL